MSKTHTSTRPTWLAMTRDRVVLELKEFVRTREQMLFIFFFPIILLVMFGTIFGTGDLYDTGVSFGQYFLAGMIATGIINTGFQSLAISIALDRDEDILKRLYATPLPASAYFAGMIVRVLAVSVVQIVILIAIGVVLFDVTLPTEAAKWWTFTWVFLLGTAASTAMGIAFSSLLRSGRAASAILTPVVLVLQFASGVFVVFTQLPGWMQTFAEIFPLKWLAQGMRSVFLPDHFEHVEAAGSWQLGATAIILTVWFAVALIVAVRTFRWLRVDDQ